MRRSTIALAGLALALAGLAVWLIGFRGRGGPVDVPASPTAESAGMKSPAQLEPLRTVPDREPATDTKASQVVTVTLRIEDPSGKPVPGADLAVTGRPSGDWWLAPSGDSEYQLTLAPAAYADPNLRFFWRAPAYYRRSEAATALLGEVAGDKTVVLRLEPALAENARLRVLDAVSQRPVAGARVIELGKPESVVGTTDASGAVEFPIYPRSGSREAHRHRLVADGYLPLEIKTGPDPADLGTRYLYSNSVLVSLKVKVNTPARGSDLEGGKLIIARRGPELRSKEFDTLGVPVPGLEFVEIARVNGHMEVSPWFWETDQLEWSHDSLVPGNYEVLAYWPRVGVASRRVQVLRGTLGIELTLDAGATVRPAGRLDEGLRIDLSTVDGWAPLQIDVPQGGAEHVPAGLYKARLTRGRLVERVLDERLQVPESGVVDVSLTERPPHLVEGRLVLPDGLGSATPLPNVRVKVRSTALEAVSDSSGRFTFAAVPVGTFVLDVQGYRFVTPGKWVVRVADDSPQVVHVGDLALRPK